MKKYILAAAFPEMAKLKDKSLVDCGFVVKEKN